MSQRLVHIVRSTALLERVQFLCRNLPNEFITKIFRINGPQIPSVNNTQNFQFRSHRLDISGWYQLASAIRKEKPDLVHLWDEPLYSSLSVAARLANPETIVVSPKLQQSESRKTSNQQHRWFRNVVIDDQRFDRFFPNCISANAGHAKSKIDLVNRLGLPKDATLICATVRGLPTKILKNLLWSTELLTNIDDNIFLLLYGKPFDSWRAGRFRNQCRLHRRVRFLVNADCPDGWLEAVDLFWSGHRCPWVVMALSMGVPVVTIKENRLPILADGRSCLFADETERADFAKKSLRILQNPLLASDLRRAGREAVSNSIGQFVSNYAMLYAKAKG